MKLRVSSDESSVTPMFGAAGLGRKGFLYWRQLRDENFAFQVAVVAHSGHGESWYSVKILALAAALPTQVVDMSRHRACFYLICSAQLQFRACKPIGLCTLDIMDTGK
jgi:hypothetical protein